MGDNVERTRAFEDGKIVVVKDGPCKGQLGLYQYRGPNYETAEVVSGCSVLLMTPDNLEEYNPFKHGILNF